MKRKQVSLFVKPEHIQLTENQVTELMLDWVKNPCLLTPREYVKKRILEGRLPNVQ